MLGMPPGWQPGHPVQIQRQRRAPERNTANGPGCRRGGAIRRRKKIGGGFFFLKLPKKGRPARWKNKVKGGILQTWQAAFGKTKIGPRNYPDCVFVVEKDFKKGKVVSSVRQYYAKGIGLIRSGFYGPSGKWIRSKSFEYVKTEGTVKTVPFFRNP